MDIYSDIEIVDLCLYIKKFKTLVISDAHFGLEESMNKSGIHIPRFQWKDTKKKIENIFLEYDVKMIVLNGDVKHEYGKIQATEWRHIIRVFDLFGERRIVIVKGNHDLFLGPIADKRTVEIVDELRLDDVLIVHGDEVPEVDKHIEVIIMGHEHCAITLRKGQRVETFKCFLRGKWKGKVLLAMPSFNELTNGTDVLKSRLISPLLINIDNFEVYAVGDKIYEFGNVKKLRKTLD